MRRCTICAWLALAVAALSALTPAAAAAARAPATQTTLAIETPLPLRLGEHPTVVVRLTTSAGTPISDEPIELFLDGARQRRGRTDQTGAATFTIRRNLVAGVRALRAVYNGSQTLAPSSASGSLAVQPWELRVQTVPPLEGVQFVLNGRPFSSDANGIARIQVDRVATYRLEILTTDATMPHVRWSFKRWESDVFVPFRYLQLPSARSITAGFDVSYRVQPSFVDLAGHAVDPGRIATFTLKNSIGGVYLFDNGQPQWLQASRVLRRRDGIEKINILYSVESVIVDGSNIVNQSQQRFNVHPNDEWRIELLLYAIRFTARDALFGFPIGRGVRLEYPNGHVAQVPFEGSDSTVTVRSLVRGIYRVSVDGAAGIAPVSPVALSRDQDVYLLVISYLDLAVVVLVMALLALGLIFAGRPQLLAAMRNLRSLRATVVHTFAGLPGRLRRAAQWHALLARGPRAWAQAGKGALASLARRAKPAAAPVRPRRTEERPGLQPLPSPHRRDPATRLAAGLVALGVAGGVAGLTVDAPGAGLPATLAGFGDTALLAMRALIVVGLCVLTLRERLHHVTSSLMRVARWSWHRPGLLVIRHVPWRPRPPANQRQGSMPGALLQPAVHPETAPHRSAADPGVAPRALIEHVIERAGAKYLADVRALSAEMGRLYQVRRRDTGKEEVAGAWRPPQTGADQQGDENRIADACV